MNTQHVIYLWSSTNVDLKSIKRLYDACSSAVGGWVTGGGAAC